MNRRLQVLIIFPLLITQFLFAQTPEVKVDLNMSGRTESECNDPNYEPWIPDNEVTISNTFEDVTFTFTTIGEGEALRATWYKAGVQSPNYARLECDGMYVDGGTDGAIIQLTISGLETGTHTFMAFLNALDSPDSYSFAPVDVYVDGSLVLDDVVPSERALTTDETQSIYLTFDATSGTDVVIKFAAETSTSATMKNVYINGFELNTPNVKYQATTPTPDDGDFHYDCDEGSASMSWVAASTAASHNIYISTDSAAVADATTSSSVYMGNQTSASYTLDDVYNMNVYYWRVDEVAGDGTITQGNVWQFKPRHVAFPGAEGYGRFAIGGRGGKVVHVTNLNDSGEGSLRYAVEEETGPRTIVFDVGGVIVSESRMVSSDQYVTIAGQTAPGEGICIQQAPFGLTGDDGITRFMRVQIGYGDPTTYDGMGLTGANYSILDHSSINFAIDEQFSSRSGKNITLQNMLIAEALNAADHQNYTSGTEHGYAGSIGGEIGSYHHNLLAHNYGRNWSLAGGLDGNGYYAGQIQIVNQVVYNFGGRVTDGGCMELDFINNYYKQGAGSTIDTYSLSIDHEGAGLGTQQAYFSGNIFQLDDDSFYCDGTDDECGRTYTISNDAEVDWETFVDEQFSPTYVTTQSAANAFKVVLSDCGVTQPVQSDRDIRLINETKNGTYSVTGSVTGKYGFPDREEDAGGFDDFTETYRDDDWDSDGDGLPDFWETYYGTSNSSASDDYSDANNDEDLDGNLDGYTALEDYLNWMADPHYFLDYGASQTIDLSALFRGFDSPSYSYSDLTSGSVSISGSTLTFTSSGCGMYSFTVSATEDGFTFDRNVNIFVESNPEGECVDVSGVPLTLVYEYVSGTEDTWNVTDNWDLGQIPRSIDTAIIRTGDVRIYEDISVAVVRVETDGVLRMIGNYTVDNIELQGGTLKVYTSNTTYGLTSDIDVQENSTIWGGSQTYSVFWLEGSLSGDGDLTKTYTGILDLDVDASEYTGDWYITEGTLRIANTTSISEANNVTISSGAVFDASVDGIEFYSLTLESGAVDSADYDVTVYECYIDGVSLSAGTYTSSHFPDYIKGTGSIIVLGNTYGITPFIVDDELFDQTNEDNLGLSELDGTETFTIFQPSASTDHYSNGAVMTRYNGYFYCMWQSSETDEDSDDTWVAYSRSTDGETWTDPMVLAASPSDGRATSGGWWQSGDSLIAYVNIWLTDADPTEGSAYYSISTDGLTWTDLAPLTMLDGSDMEGVFEQDPHALDDGRIINAVHFQPGILVSPVYTDDPTGLTGWVKASMQNLTYSDDVTREIEPSWFQREDTLVMIFRDQNSTYYKLASVSVDRGETWSTPTLTNMPDSRSKQCAGNFDNGAAFMVNNPNDDKYRVPLAITIADDAYYFDKSYLLRSESDRQEQQYTGTYKSLGYHYPKAMVYNDYVYISYATNKEDVEYTRVPIDSIYPPTYDCAGVKDGSAYYDNCDNCVGGTTGLEACEQIVAEAEDIYCYLDGSIDSDNEGFSGTGFVNTGNGIDSTVTINIYAEEATTITFGTQIANGGDTDRPAQILINGTEAIANYSMPSTGAWTTYAEVDTSLTLSAGINEISMVATTSGGLANIDYFYLYGDAEFAGCEITQSIDLVVGWNLVSLYAIPTDNLISSVFPNATEVKTLDEYYNTSQDEFLNTMTDIEAGTGYLVYNTVAETITISGVNTGYTRYLQNGLNLIGCPYSETTTFEDAFGTELDEIQSIQSFDGEWTPDGTQTIESLEPGKAYFIVK